LNADTDVIVQVDMDNDTSETFQIRNGAGVTISETDEAGNQKLLRDAALYPVPVVANPAADKPIVQCGTVSTVSGAATITFSPAFGSAPVLMLTPQDSTDHRGGSDSAPQPYIYAVSGSSATVHVVYYDSFSAQYSCWDGTVHWIAIGY